MRVRSALLGLLGLCCGAGLAHAALPTGAPAATVDLATRTGVDEVRGVWRYSDVRIVDAGFRAPGPDGQPSNVPSRTYDYEPRAGAIDFDDRAWTAIEPESLAQRRGQGRLGFNWYRIRITIPARLGDYDPTGSTVVFQTTLDDYAEIWVDGELPRHLGQQGGSVIAGWNAANRLVIARNVKPGQQIQLAVFGANGPLSNPPTNYIYVRDAILEFHPGNAEPIALVPQEVNVEVERLDPEIDRIVPANPKAFKLADGFQFTEGPVWMRSGRLLFSDPNANRIYEYDPDGMRLRVFRESSGYSGSDIGEYHQPGSNGLTLDAHGRLTINEHGNRRVTRVESDGNTTVLADTYQGRRLNSPNDLVYRSDGALYFTDPPFGLPRTFDDSRKELPYSGVFRWRDGRLQLLAKELKGPNGLAFSPDEKFLYVSNWDEARKVILRYPVKADGTLGRGVEFFNMNAAPGAEALDGLKVDTEGHVYASGPGGVWILAADGRHLGTLRLPRLPANFAWGDADGKALYLTARSTLYRVPMLVNGLRP